MAIIDRLIPARFRKARPAATAPLPAKLEYLGPVPHAQTRASKVGRLVAMLTGGKNVPQRPTENYENNAREGYEKNPIVYRCVRLIAEALKAMPVIVMDGDKEVEGHPLAAVFASPNPRQDLSELLDDIVGHYFLAGEFFLEGVVLPRTGQIAELYALRPDKVAIVPDDDGGVLRYDFEAATGVHRFDVPRTGFSPILHARNWNPRDHWRGMPVVKPASAPADEYAETVQQNRALLNNSAMPSGALVYMPKEGGGNLTEEAWERLKKELAEEHTGPQNHGKPLVLDNLDWKPMGMTPRDAMAVEQRSAAARETALAMGVPPLLLGLPGDNTYANYQEANLAFWRQTVWPFAMFIMRKASKWVQPIYGPTITCQFDREASPMAEAEAKERWERTKDANFLTTDEKREVLGYEALPDGKGEHVLVPSGLSILDDVIMGEPDPEAEGEAAYGRPAPGEED